MYSGWPLDNGKHAEVIDLLNQDANCNDFGMLSRGVSSAFGGKVADSFLVCGGFADSPKRRWECYKVGETTPFLNLPYPRGEGASVVLPNNSLLTTGESSLHAQFNNHFQNDILDILLVMNLKFSVNQFVYLVFSNSEK